MLFDEAQKITTPGIRITDAAKAMNADFRVLLRGTPVENRFADLWCIGFATRRIFAGGRMIDVQKASTAPCAARRIDGQALADWELGQLGEECARPHETASGLHDRHTGY